MSEMPCLKFASFKEELLASEHTHTHIKNTPTKVI